jgi:hypothetical protein
VRSYFNIVTADDWNISGVKIFGWSGNNDGIHRRDGTRSATASSGPATTACVR